MFWLLIHWILTYLGTNVETTNASRNHQQNWSFAGKTRFGVPGSFLTDFGTILVSIWDPDHIYQICLCLFSGWNNKRCQAAEKTFSPRVRGTIYGSFPAYISNFCGVVLRFLRCPISGAIFMRQRVLPSSLTSRVFYVHFKFASGS